MPTKISNEIKDMKIQEISANRTSGEDKFRIFLTLKGEVSKEQLDSLIEAYPSLAISYSFDDFHNVTIYLKGQNEQYK